MLLLKVREHLQMMPRPGEGQKTVRSDLGSMKKFPVSGILAFLEHMLVFLIVCRPAVLFSSIHYAGTSFKAGQLSWTNPRDRLSSTPYR